MEEYTLTFAECGGYDCMFGAWVILDATGKPVICIDQGDFGQIACEWSQRIPEAEHLARLVVQRLNT